MKTLTRHGDGWALVIDRAILDRLQIDADTLLDVTTDGRSLMIVPVDPRRREKFEAALKKTLEEYAGVFRRLAE